MSSEEREEERDAARVSRRVGCQQTSRLLSDSGIGKVVIAGYAKVCMYVSIAEDKTTEEERKQLLG